MVIKFADFQSWPGAAARLSGSAETIWLRHPIHCWTSQQWHPELVIKPANFQFSPSRRNTLAQNAIDSGS